VLSSGPYVSWAPHLSSPQSAFLLPPPSTPLKQIRDSIAQSIHLSPDAFKLIHAGAVMRDDNAPISAYKIRPSSTIAVIQILQQPIPPTLSTPQSSKSEQSTISAVQQELQRVRTELAPGVHAFHNSPSPKEHARLSELLLQSLLRLDALAMNSDAGWDDARRQRKDAVKEVQSLLDTLDASGSSS